MGEADKMSGTLKRAGIFPAETIHIVSNGELAGDLPGAIMSTARAAEAEFTARDSSWAQLSRFLFYIPMGILTLLMAKAMGRSVANIMFGVLLIFTGANVPVDQLPGWMQSISNRSLWGNSLLTGKLTGISVKSARVSRFRTLILEQNY